MRSGPLTTLSWLVVLSNGQVIKESDLPVIPGERKPWVRLMDSLDDLHLIEVSIESDKGMFHIATSDFSRFDLNDIVINPDYYSLQYHLEVDDIFGAQKEEFFLDIAAHYVEKDFVLHCIFDQQFEHNYMIITKGHESLAPSPPRI